jgi:2-polyprenyl-3-methyl-5-hydroxy-6-metoxy-1,4-benzoquinol methylase
MRLKSEKDAWLRVVEPEDLDTHMRDIGQASANCEIIKEMFRKRPLGENSKVLVHGCGTCQMFEYIAPSDIVKGEMTFADISSKMLRAAGRRLRRYRGLSYHILVDDIENTSINEHYDAVLLVLILLHVDWKRSLENMIRLNPSCFYIIEQKQGPERPAVTRGRVLPRSIRRYTKVADAELVEIDELTEFLSRKGYNLVYKVERKVPDDKLMMGLVYSR